MNNAFNVFALLLWAAAAALLIWLPRIWRRGGAPETNEDWLRLRQRELEGEAEGVAEGAAVVAAVAPPAAARVAPHCLPALSRARQACCVKRRCLRLRRRRRGLRYA